MYTRSETESLCPVCLRKIPAALEEAEGGVAMVKYCEDHGEFRTPYWLGAPSISEWHRPAPASERPKPLAAKDVQCPHGCGLCERHLQTTCTALLEVTGRCDLSCAFCFADAPTKSLGEPSLADLRDSLAQLKAHAPNCNLQLSGGEPTMRDDLPEIVAAARDSGFSFVQLNSNGVRLGRERGYAERLADRGLSSVFLQFDGTTPEMHERLRGSNLLADKLAAIENCGRAGLGVVLVPTIVPGVNDHDLGNLVRLALRLNPVVRGVHFQPVSHFGRCPSGSGNKRLTLPEVLSLLVGQSDGLLKAEDFAPSSCEHPLCSFHGKFLILENGSVRPLSGRTGSERQVVTLDEGASASIAQVASQWRGTPIAAAQTRGVKSDLDRFLERYPAHSLTVSCMAFMDAWSIDLERARQCCIHVVDQKRGLVPFCLHYLTSASGERLHAHGRD